jgi:hypothetical protein
MRPVQLRKSHLIPSCLRNFSGLVKHKTEAAIVLGVFDRTESVVDLFLVQLLTREFKHNRVSMERLSLTP